MLSSKQLLATINGFIARTGMSKSYFGYLAVRDSKLVARLESGGSVTLDTCAAIVKFMESRDHHMKGKPNG
jgi:hypothetical protein